MTVLAYAGNFTLNNATGNQAITGLGFQPKLVIFAAQFWNPISGGQQLRRTFGAATSNTAQWSMCWSFSDNPDVHDQQYVTNRCIKWNDAATDVEQISADFVSMDGDGFTIHVDAGSLSPVIHYYAIGGTDVSAKVGTFVSSTTNGASQAVTGVGFQPSLILFGKGPFDTSGAPVGECHSMLGVADNNTGLRACTGMYLQGNSPPPVLSYQRTDKAIAMVDATSTYNQTADVTSFDADGFTIGWNLAYLTAGNIGYIALGGTARYAASAINAPSTTGAQSISGAGFTPVGSLFLSNGFPASNTLVRSNSYNEVGFADGLNQNSIGVYLVSNSTSVSAPYGTSDNSTNLQTEAGATLTTEAGLPISIVAGNCIRAPDGSGLNRDAATYVSNDANGFTLNWTTVTGSNDQIIAVSFGAAASTVFPVGVVGTAGVGTVTVAAKAGVALSGVVGTSALGTVTGAPRFGSNAPSLLLTFSVGSPTIAAACNLALSGVATTAQLGTISSGIVLGTTLVTLPALLTSALHNSIVELPVFGVEPSFVPDHVNTVSDPSQPTRWVNVNPP